MSALAGEFVINDHQNGQVIDKEGQGFRGGLVERDLGTVSYTHLTLPTTPYV